MYTSLAIYFAMVYYYVDQELALQGRQRALIPATGSIFTSGSVSTRSLLYVNMLFMYTGVVIERTYTFIFTALSSSIITPDIVLCILPLGAIHESTKSQVNTTKDNLPFMLYADRVW